MYMNAACIAIDRSQVITLDSISTKIHPYLDLYIYVYNMYIQLQLLTTWYTYICIRIRAEMEEPKLPSLFKQSFIFIGTEELRGLPVVLPAAGAAASLLVHFLYIPHESLL